MNEIHVIVTTMSGSIKDAGKINKIKPEFEKYFPGATHVHVVDTHQQAYDEAVSLARSGAGVIISAGGAGTFNSVVRGCCDADIDLRRLRVGFLRKGSADLIGKALGISDEVTQAVKDIAGAIETDQTMAADIISVSAEYKSTRQLQNQYIIGFGGFGIFGYIPVITENRFKKQYKGFLGYFFGDRGPFMVGALSAAIRYYARKLFFVKNTYTLVLDGKSFKEKKYSTIMLLNGDLGKHFPLAPGMPLGDGYFKIVALEDKGFFSFVRQFKECWQGNIQADGVDSFMAKEMEITQHGPGAFWINIDGLGKKVNGTVRCSVIDRLLLLSARK